MYVRIKKRNVILIIGIALLYNIALESIWSGPKQSIAILPFVNSTKNKQFAYLSDTIPEIIITNLSQLTTYNYIESRAVDALLREKKLDAVGLTSGRAREISKLLQADYYIVGSFIIQGDTFQTSARIFEAESGKIVGAAEIEGRSDDTLLPTIRALSFKLAARLGGKEIKESVLLAEKEQVEEPPEEPEPAGPPLFDSYVGGYIGGGNIGAFSVGLYGSHISVNAGLGFFAQEIIPTGVNVDSEYNVGTTMFIAIGTHLKFTPIYGMGAELSYSVYRGSEDKSYGSAVISLATGPKYFLTEVIEFFGFYSPQYALESDDIGHKIGLSFRYIFSQM